MQNNTLTLSVNDFSKDYYESQENGIYIHKYLTPQMEMNLFKYMDVTHLIELLHTHKLFVANRSLFRDKREQGYKENLRNKFSILTIANQKTKDAEKWIQVQTQKYNDAYNICISCWTTDKHVDCDESIMNWNCYGQNTCRIQTTVARLINSINFNDYDILLAPIEYKKECMDINAGDRIFRKYIAYQDEQEIRMCILSRNRYELLDVDLQNMIEKIRLSPYLSKSLMPFLEDTFPFLKGKVELSHIVE